MNDIKQMLLKGMYLEFEDANENVIAVWFQPKTQLFCLELNAKVVKATLSFVPIERFILNFKGLRRNF